LTRDVFVCGVKMLMGLLPFLFHLA
jgi:hypothetical protein